jgi:hypothetical protein
MPKGLPDVVQKFAADNSDYLEKLNQNKDAIRGEVESLEEHRAAVERNKEAVAKFADELGEMQRKMKDIQDLGGGFRQLGTDELGDNFTALGKALENYQRQAQLAADMNKEITDQIDAGNKVVDEATARNEERNQLMAETIQRHSDLIALTRDLNQASSEYNTTQAKLSMAGSDYNANLRETVDLIKQANRESTLLAAGGNFGGGGTAGALRELRSGGAGAGAAAAFLTDALGGGGSGGGGGGLMTAAAYADAVTGFVKRWAGAAHYAIMGTMEALSTIVPATVALGGAAAVSIQAGEQIVGRGQAIMNTAEALGYPAYGLSAGNLLGVGGALQTAQNRYNGGLYGLTGGLMNLAQLGQGAFLQQGGQTMAMMDRAMAAVVLNAQGPNGTAAQLGSALGGGTDFLRQFGDVGANVGDLLLGLAPHLPGVGADWLSILSGITGGAAGGVRFLNTHGGGNILGAGLAGEAGWRLGTPLIGLLGKGLTGLGGLAGRLGLGTTGMTAADIADIQALTGGALGEGALGLEGLGGSGLAGLLGAGGAALGGVTGPLAAVAAIGAWEGSMLGRYKTPVGQGIASRTAAIGNAPFDAALQPLTAALAWATPQLTGGPNALPMPSQLNDPRGFVTRQREADQANLHSAIASWTGQISGNVAAAAQLVPALAKMGIHGASFADAAQIATASLLDVNHAIDPKTHQLTAPAIQQVANFIKAAGGAQMTGAPAPLMAAAAAQTIMSSPQMKALQNVNSAMDSMTQIMTGGAAGNAALFAMLGGTPVTSTHGGIQIAASAQPATAAFANALRSPFSATGATAWSTFAGQGGLLPTEQQNLDQLRTAMSLGGLSSGQAGQLGAFQLMQLLPMARNSPAALANLMSMGMQAGIPGMQYFSGSSTSGANLAKQYALAAAAIGKAAPSAAGATTLTNQEAVRLSNLPGVAGQFMQSLSPSLASATLGDMTTQGIALRGAPTSQAALNAMVADLRSQGVKPGQMGGTAAAILSQLGATHAVQVKVQAEVGKIAIPEQHVKVTPDMGKSPTALLNPGGKPIDIPVTPKVSTTGSSMAGLTQAMNMIAQHAQAGTITYKAKVDPPQIPRVVDQFFQVRGQLHMPAIPHIPDQSFTITGHVVIVGGGNIGVGGGAVAVGAGGHTMHGQSGFRVPGYGSGDTFPAMLEPGELVVPKNMVNAGAVDHLRGSIPGFQGGGMIDPMVPFFPGLGVAFRASMEGMAQALISDMQQVMSSFGPVNRGNSLTGNPIQPFGGAGGSIPKGTVSDPVAVHVASASPVAAAQLGTAGAPVPAAASKVFDAYEKTLKNMPGPWSQLASQILNGLIAGIKNAPHETSAAAQALVNKVKTEIAYGQGVTATAVAGLNLGGMQVATPTMTAQGKPYQYYIDQQNIAAGGQPGSVQEQMGSYLQAMQSFQGDMGKLAKGGLQKRLLQQLYAAGPIQGDAEAQSILGGQGGIKAANQLYNQINSIATKLGVQAIGNIYGQPAAGLHGKNVHAGANVTGTAQVHALQSAINSLHGKTVTINVDVNTSGGGGGGTAGLSKSQINMIIKGVQQGLLQQAKRNRVTGVTIPGYGA